jgi:hypothetical protein
LSFLPIASILSNKENILLRMKFIVIIKSVCLVLITILLFGGNSYAQIVSVNTYLDTTSILIGDQINFHVVVEQPKGAKVAFPVLTDSITNKVEIISVSKIDTQVLKNGNLLLVQPYLISSFDSGFYTIPSLKFIVDNQNHDTLASAPLQLIVNTLPIKEQNAITDIKGVIDIPITFKEILPYILIGIGAWLLIALGVYIYTRIKNNKPIFKILEKPKEPAHVIAFRELDKLKNDKLWQQGQFKQYFTRVTDITRAYIELRFEVPAMESTSDEILAIAKGIDQIDDKLFAQLKELLELADLVKFAKVEPLPDENENAWKIAYSFVEKTFQLADQLPNMQEKAVVSGN